MSALFLDYMFRHLYSRCRHHHHHHHHRVSTYLTRLILSTIKYYCTKNLKLKVITHQDTMLHNGNYKYFCSMFVFIRGIIVIISIILRFGHPHRHVFSLRQYCPGAKRSVGKWIKPFEA